MKKTLLCAAAVALMLGGCSKDDTEISSVNGSSDVVFTAGMTIGNDTRTGIGIDPNDGAKTVYTWDLGDMVGVSVANGKVVPFINLSEGSSPTAKFTYSPDDADYIGEGNTAYFVYPYNEDNVISLSGRNAQVSLSVPAAQRYRDNSFAPMTAPAVTYTDSFKKGADYTFKAVTSFIRVPLIGSGTVKELKMTVANDANLKIAGRNTVVINSATPKLTANADTWAETISIDFGNGGLDLSYGEKKYVVFVVPADLPVKAKTKFSFTATLENADDITSKVVYTVPDAYKPTTLPVNTMVTLASKEGISFGTEKQVLISDANDFLKYAYAAAHSSSEAGDYYYNDGTDKLKSAVLLNDIDFASFKGGDVYANAGDDATLKAAADWYISNGDCFIPFAKARLIGDGDGVEISNIKVKGAGILGASMSLSNIIFTSAVVDADKSATASLIGTLPTAVSNVKFNGGEVKNLPEGVASAMLNTASSTNLGSVDVEYSDGIQLFARTFTLAKNINLSDEGMEDYCGGQRFGMISPSRDGYIITVASSDVEYILAAAAGAKKAFSVMDETTSYWTGITPATVPAEDDVVTAEDLAYYVNHGSTTPVAMTNDIDLMGKDWKVANARLTIDGKKDETTNYTIKNATLNTADDATGTVYYSLLGGTVTASNLNVASVNINVSLPKDGGKMSARIGGLGYRGSANNVTVDGMAISVEDGVTVSGTVGGMFATMNRTSENNVVKALNLIGDVKFAAMFGTVGSATNKFNKNTVEYFGGAKAYALVDTWSIKTDASVKDCVNPGSVIVNTVKISPVDAGITSLVVESCNILQNTLESNIAVNVNGTLRTLVHGDNTFVEE